jgi:uncharacterized caspase-like protein
VNPLEIARADAESIRDVLMESFRFPESNISLLLDSQATRKRIMERFLSYESLHPDDRLVVFFAGHGTTVTGVRGPIGYLVPVDGKVNDKSTLIRWDELTHNADIIPAKHIFFVMDACYSGLAVQRSTPAGEKRFLTDMLRRRSRQVIAAGKGDQTVADGGGPTGKNSIFTGHLLEGLEGRAADEHGIITASSLMSYAYRRVGSDPRSNQTPHFGHIDGDGDFILSIPNDVQIAVSPSSDFLITTVPEQPEALTPMNWSTPTPGFAERSSYSDPEKKDFGLNDWSKQLGEGVATNASLHSVGWLL